MAKDTFFSSNTSINCRGKLLNLESPIVMGILNVTPDSFYDGGKYTSDSAIIKQAEKILSEGARIIDLGAVSTRPGAKEVSAEEEEERLLPVIKVIVNKFPEAIISVDTWRASIAEKAIDSGASIINDISGGIFDNEMFKTIARVNVPYIMMHTKGTPDVMQIEPTYENIVKEISKFFAQQIEKLRLLGVNDIIIDPGFGFGKTLEHNYLLMKQLDYFGFFELPILVGVSRKSMIHKLLDIKPEKALNGTTVLNTTALLKGAKILRVHDVKEAVEVVKIVEKYKKS